MPAAEKDVVAAIFRKVADAIRNLDPADWDSVAQGKFKIEVVTGGGGEHRVETELILLAENELSGLAVELKEVVSREAGFAILERHQLSKDGIVQLARYLDLRAQKRDSIEKIKDRIIEATIGFRLRSRAVQGGMIGSGGLEIQENISKPTQEGVSGAESSEKAAENES